MAGLMKGTVRGYDALSGLAEVELVGGRGAYVTVPVATHLDGRSVHDGLRCALLVFDEQNQGDMVLVATYDEGPLMGAATISHSDLDDLDADDHPQYLTEGRLAAADPSIMAWPSAATGKVWTKRASGAGWESLPSSGGLAIGHASNSGPNTTASTTYVDLPNGSLTMTLSGASDIVLTFSAVAYTSYASEHCFVRLLNSAGSQVGDEVRLATGSEGRAHSYTWKFSESSGGSKTWKIQYRAGYGGSRNVTIAARTLTAWVVAS